ncbi:MAG: hypothetical protein DRP56_10160 [Planctomycetota bacterium]|nr:MAG: hypothetical protein DRP56_10160 [Planctomycetota bacterium]
MKAPGDYSADIFIKRHRAACAAALLCRFWPELAEGKSCPSILRADLRFLVELAKWRGGMKLISGGEIRR